MANGNEYNRQLVDNNSTQVATNTASHPTQLLYLNWEKIPILPTEIWIWKQTEFNIPKVDCWADAMPGMTFC